MLPKIDLRRTYLIARRDFLGYVKTWGFWLSFLMPIIFGSIGFFASDMIDGVEPIRYETILDDTGLYGDAILKSEIPRRRDREWNSISKVLGSSKLSAEKIKELKEKHSAMGLEGLIGELPSSVPGMEPDKLLKAAVSKTQFIDPPADDLESIKSFVTGNAMVSVDGEKVKLNGVLHIHELDGKVQADYWSTNLSSQYVQGLARDYFRGAASKRYLKSGGLTPEGYREARAGTTRIKVFDPSKSSSGGQEGQAVSIVDRIPTFVAAGASLLLWLTIFSGAYMLLTSMLEEKLNKLMEMMLATTRFSEIIFGKLLGVAALTITAMLPYLLFGAFVAIGMAVAGPPDAVSQLAAAFTPKLIIFFPIFLVLGYVFYGSLFIALGALAESMQDAQTLTTPIMLVLTACILVVPLGIQSPDSPLITLASWFPLSAPFAAIIRLPMDPPWWELALSALFLFIMSIGVIALAGRIFRYGVLSGAGVKGVTDWIKRVIFRRKTLG